MTPETRAQILNAIRVIAFVLHAAMAVVVTSLMFACRVQAYTNHGFRTIALDWQVALLLFFALCHALLVLTACVVVLAVMCALHRSGRTAAGPGPATARSNATACLSGG